MRGGGELHGRERERERGTTAVAVESERRGVKEIW